MSTHTEQKPNVNVTSELSFSKLAEESTHARHGRKAAFFLSVDRQISQEHFIHVKM